MNPIERLKSIVQALIMASSEPVSPEQMQSVFDEEERPTIQAIKKVLNELLADNDSVQVYELKRVSSGYRYQVRQEYASWISKLFIEKPPRLSRAYLETLVIIAYRQPATRADIEEIRGVAVSSNTIRSLLERQWIRVVGHKDVPGKPAIFATTKQFLDYFNLESLEALPTLQEVKDIDVLMAKLEGKEAPQNLNLALLDNEDTQDGTPSQTELTKAEVDGAEVDGAEVDGAEADGAETSKTNPLSHSQGEQKAASEDKHNLACPMQSNNCVDEPVT